MRKSFASSLEKIDDYRRLQIKARITSHEVKREDSFMGHTYVIYKLDIYTFYKNWTVNKRYSDFEKLHKSLQEKLTNMDTAEFPPKRYFKNSESTIKERKSKLESYLNYLFQNVNICSVAEILEFIEIEKELILLLMKNNTMIESKTSVAAKRYCSMKKLSMTEGSVKKARSVDSINLVGDNYYHSFLDYKRQDKNTSEKSMNMMVIEEFLRNLELKAENKYDIIKTFEQFLKGKKSWPNFKREEINKLLNGETCAFNSNVSLDSDNSEASNKIYLKGLLYHCGSIEQNLLGAETCLEFLGKLIDYEYNPDCEAYIYILKTSRIENLHSIRLNEHISNSKFNIVNIAFRIIRAIVTEDKAMEIKLKKLISDEEIIEKFLKWQMAE